MILEVFSTRELVAVLFWAIIIAYLLTSKDGRLAIFRLIKTLFLKAYIKIYFIIVSYAAVIVYILTKLQFWDWILIKDIFIWLGIVAIPICSKAFRLKLEEYSFSNMIKDNFILSAILEFFFCEFTFSLWKEILIFVVVLIVYSVKDYDRDNPELKKVHKFSDGLAVIIGLLVFIATAIVAIEEITRNGIIDILISFSIPVIFSIAYLPLIYFIALNTKYNELFSRVKIRNNISEIGMGRKKREIFFACGFSHKRLIEFDRAYSGYISRVKCWNDDDSFFKFINKFNNNEWNDI